MPRVASALHFCGFSHLGVNMMIKSSAAKESGQQSPGRALDYALDVVAAMGEAGLTAVPIKPTTEMLTEGARAGECSVETAWKIYQAMIAAAE